MGNHRGRQGSAAATRAGRAVIVVLLGLLTFATSPFTGASAEPTVGGPVSGVAFRDYDADGTQDAVEPGVGGIEVAVTCVSDTGDDDTLGTADDAYGAPVTTTSIDGGGWAVAATGSPCRVEFTIPAALDFLRPGAAGGTSVQFVAAPATGVDFTVNNPADYCQNNPTLATVCYHAGPVTGANANAAQVLTFADNATGDLAIGAGNTAATFAEVGSVYGLAPDAETGGWYAASFVKRHVGLAGDPGTVYRVPPPGSPDPVTALVTLPAGTDPHPANGAGNTAWLRDGATWDAVGKVGLGDIDISEDGQTLYAVNLFDRALYRIPVADPTSYDTVAIPSPAGCAAGDWRPFAVSVDDGRVYVGGVCSNQSTGTVDANFAGHVYRSDVAGTSFTEILTIPFDGTSYPRKCADPNGAGTANTSSADNGNDPNRTCATTALGSNTNANWMPWRSATAPTSFPSTYPRYSTPWLTDLDVDSSGHLAVGLRSRFADQTGNGTYAPGGSSTTLYQGIGLGDLVKACRVGDTWSLETNGSCAGTAGSGVGNGEGPGGGEFFNGDDHYYHDQLGVGGVTAVKASGDVVNSMFDPLPGQGDTFDGGITWQSSATGARNQTLRVFNSTAGSSDLFGKANGLGDVEVLCDQAPIEIGNRVWYDANQNGQQDPGEPPIPGVTVELHRGPTVIGTTTTDGNGNYLFGGADDENLDPGESVEPDTDYLVLVPNAFGANQQAPLEGASVTFVGAGPDTTDSDAWPSGPDAVIFLTTGSAGDNDHSYDIGFTPPRFDLALRKRLAAGQDPQVAPGDPVTFTIEVFNQGDLPATDVELVDYLPTGLALDDGDWTDNGDGTASITLAGPIAVGASTTVDITTTVDADLPAGDLDNLAEIVDAVDGQGDPVTDIDSTPDTDPGNDVLVDDVIDNQGLDEDDHDIASVGVLPYDLALIKVLGDGQSSVIQPGDQVTWRVLVANQGGYGSGGFTVTDTVPTGMDFVSAGQGGTWDAGDRTVTWTVAAADELGVGEQTTFDLTTVVTDPAAGPYRNWAEISADSGPDEDSTPDADTGSDQTPPNDDVIDHDDPQADVVDGDEDDNDYEEVAIDLRYDLALVKELAQGQAPEAVPGDTVDYVVTVANQGNLPSGTFVVTDTVPVGMDFVSAGQGGVWNAAARTVTWTVDAADQLAAGDTTTFDLRLSVATGTGAGTLRNWAEISGDTSAFAGGDEDSTPDTDTGDGLTPPNDDVVDHDDISQDTVPGDEDDNDYEDVTVPEFDLALRKTLAAGQPAQVRPNDTVTFTIEVFNQGDRTATDIELVDHVPDALSLADVDWTDNGDGTASITVPGPLAPGASTTVDITMTVDDLAPLAVARNVAEIADDADESGNPVVDRDSTPDTDPDDDTLVDDVIDNSDGDQDDHDVASVEVIGIPFDLALRKTLAAGQPAQVRAGDTATFTVEVFNQGEQAATQTVLTDRLPAGTTLEDADWTDNGDGTASITVPGPIAPGASTTVDITVRVDADLAPGTIDNLVEISADADRNGGPIDDVDSTPDANLDDDTLVDDVIDNTDGDEDDHDIASLEVQAFDLALRKTVGTTFVTLGQQVPFTLTVFNQGDIPAANVTLTDRVPAGMAFDPALNPGWVDNGDGTVATTVAGPLAAGDDTAVTLTLTVTGASADGRYLNVAEISSATDDTGTTRTDVDSTPDTDLDDDALVDDVIDGTGGDEDDHDVAEVRVFDLALRKTTTAGVVQIGDVVPFTITVFNQGTEAATDIEVTDLVPAEMTFDPAENSGWTDNGDGTVSFTVPGPLAPGDTDAVLLNLTVTANAGTITNEAEITDASDSGGTPAPDFDSTPDSDFDNDVLVDNAVNDEGGDEDDHDIAAVGAPAFDLALRKTTGVTRAWQGDDVTWSIEVFNQGEQAATDIDVTDYVPAGLTFDSAANPGWTDNGDGTVTTTIAGPLAPGDSTTVTIVLQVAADVAPGATLRNHAEISAATDEGDRPAQDVDSTADTDNGDFAVDDVIDNAGGDEDDHDYAEVDVPVMDLALRKTLAAGQPSTVYVGESVGFTVEVFNQGDTTATDIAVTDTLPTGFSLDAAASPAWTDNGDGTVSTVLAGPVAPGDSVTVDVTLVLDVRQAGAPVNLAEIGGQSDDGGTPRPDADSTPDTDPANDTYVDDVIDGAGGDEDDHDGAEVTTPPFDLALRKDLADGQSAVVYPGRDVRFRVTVFNQGEVTATNVEVVDRIPVGTSFDPTVNPDWTDNGDGTVSTTLPGPLAPAASASVELVLRVDTPGTKDNLAEISGAEDTTGRTPPDVDSTPDADLDDDVLVDDVIDNTGGDQDDHDIATIVAPTFDLALRKTVAGSDNITVGQPVTFSIEVFNQGDVAATDIDVVDYVPEGLRFDPAANPRWVDDGDGTVSTRIDTLLEPGESAVVEIVLTVVTGEIQIDNLAEITGSTDGDGDTPADVDSLPDDDPSNDTLVDDVIDNTDGDEDDHDVATISTSDVVATTATSGSTLPVSTTTLPGTFAPPPDLPAEREEELPRTGSDLLHLVAIATLLMGLGALGAGERNRRLAALPARPRR